MDDPETQPAAETERADRAESKVRALQARVKRLERQLKDAEERAAQAWVQEPESPVRSREDFREVVRGLLNSAALEPVDQTGSSPPGRKAVITPISEDEETLAPADKSPEPSLKRKPKPKEPKDAELRKKEPAIAEPPVTAEVESQFDAQWMLEDSKEERPPAKEPDKDMTPEPWPESKEQAEKPVTEDAQNVENKIWSDDEAGPTDDEQSFQHFAPAPYPKRRWWGGRR